MTETNYITKIKDIGICSKIYNTKHLSGGSINQASCYETDKGNLFVKSNTDKEASEMFKAEALALERMDIIKPGFAPKPIHYEEKNHDVPAFIVTEYISMKGNTSSRDIQQKMGTSLAQLHSGEQTDKFGFDVTSFCGTTELNNDWNTDWCQFWCKQRMEPLFDQVRGNNPDLDACGKKLCVRMEHWLGPDALPKVKPSLLHGDLWSGNWAVHAKTNQPVIFDPAAYYGHNEAEFGMMKMFGGISQTLFDAYDNAFDSPVIEGREERVLLYELYHHLNHYAMFGGSYGWGCLDLMEQLL
ncbi:unnamed protein product [Rhizopus stolonifer]